MGVERVGWGGPHPELDFPTQFYLNLTKIAKVGFWGGFWVGGAGGWGRINTGLTLHVFRFSCISPKMTSIQNFIYIGHKL